MRCDTCDTEPCANPRFCRSCRDADARLRTGQPPQYDGPIHHNVPTDWSGKVDGMSPIDRALAERDELKRRYGPKRGVIK